MRRLIGSSTLPPPKKNQSRENVLFLKTRNKLTNEFSQSCVCTIFILINNLPMQNELTLAYYNFVACKDNIHWTNLFSFHSSTMSNKCRLLHIEAQIVSFSDRSFLRNSGKDCLVKLEIWLVMTNDRPWFRSLWRSRL